MGNVQKEKDLDLIFKTSSKLPRTDSKSDSSIILKSTQGTRDSSNKSKRKSPSLLQEEPPVQFLTQTGLRSYANISTAKSTKDMYIGLLAEMEARGNLLLQEVMYLRKELLGSEGTDISSLEDDMPISTTPIDMSE